MPAAVQLRLYIFSIVYYVSPISKFSFASWHSCSPQYNSNNVSECGPVGYYNENSRQPRPNGIQIKLLAFKAFAIRVWVCSPLRTPLHSAPLVRLVSNFSLPGIPMGSGEMCRRAPYSGDARPMPRVTRNYGQWIRMEVQSQLTNICSWDALC